MADLQLIKQKFVHEQPREGQLDAIDFIIESFNTKRIVVLEGPCGSGKSVIGATVSEFFDTCYYLTAQKLLQAQLVREFSNNDRLSSNFLPLMGRATYPCTFYERFPELLTPQRGFTPQRLEKIKQKTPDCASGFCRENLKAYRCDRCFLTRDKGALDVLPPGKSFSACSYYEQVGLALQSPKVTMNYSSFLAQTYHAERFGQRDILICDEAHNIQSIILDFVSLTLSDHNWRAFGITIPEFEHPTDYADWIVRSGVRAIIEQQMKKAATDNDFKKVDEFNELLEKIKRFLESATDTAEEWVADFKKNVYGKHTYNSVMLRPVYPRHFTDDLLLRYGKKVLLLSATILNLSAFCNATGIDRDQVAALRMKNRIPVKHRQVLVVPIASATGGEKNMKNWAPALTKAVDQIAEKHKMHRGIIHTHNFSICKHLLANSTAKKRFLFQNDFPDKQAMLAKHAESKNTILIAPALHEGIDLVGDLSRFQVVCKVPFPNYFDDKQLARRAELDWDYILWLTALKMVQSCGRSVRSNSDWAITYILDSNMRRFLDNADHMLPTWFTESILHVDPKVLTE